MVNQRNMDKHFNLNYVMKTTSHQQRCVIFNCSDKKTNKNFISDVLFLLYIQNIHEYKKYTDWFLFMKSPSDLPRCEPGFGCFKACPLTTCESVVMWRRSGNFVDFKIVARLDRPNNRWVAIGFSPTGRMVCFIVVSV